MSTTIDFKKTEIARLKFIMTMGCNFRCDYCFEGGKSNLHLSVDDAVSLGKQVLSQMAQPDLTILYFGGEPLLRFQDIQEITTALYIFNENVTRKKLNFSIITNGSILSPTMIRHLVAYRYWVSVSCDGTKEAQDCHRQYVNGAKVTYDRVLATIQLLQASVKDLCISMVVTKENVRYLYDGFKMFVEMGIRNFAISPVFDNVRFTPDEDDYREELMKIGRYARTVDGRLVINPPLDKGWEEDNVVRRMSRSERSVNVELSPVGLQILPEGIRNTTIDFSLKQGIIKVPASPEVLRGLAAAESEAHIIYRGAL